MRTSRLFALGALAASFAWLLAGGCSASDSPRGSGGPTAGSGGSLGDAQTDGTIVNPDAPSTNGGTGNALSPLCGSGECVPDDRSACRNYEPPVDEPAGGAASGGAAGAASAGEGGQSLGGAGLGGQGGAETGAEGGASGDGGAAAGASGAAGANGAGAGGDGGTGNVPEPVNRYSCQVARQNNQPLRQCERAGAGAENAPCFSSADCGGGLACVTEGDAGRCLHYCCAAETTCGSGTYCAERQLRKASDGSNNTEPARVPVCVPADDCSLEDQFPCPPGKDCRCQGDTACMVVRSDGTTTCVVPGAGQQGDACPCAWNHVCSSVTNECVKICHTDPAKNDCGAQKCQASSELPQNFGVCVGPVQ